MDKDKMFFNTIGFKVRVGLSIVIWTGWLCFLVLYTFLLANSWGHTLLEGLAVIIVSLIIAVVITALLWVFWGMSFAAKHGDMMGKGMCKEIESYVDERIDEKLKKEK